jgi:hypothetical protein
MVVLMDELKLGMGSNVSGLDLELKNTNRELDKGLNYRREAPRGLKGGEAGRPGVLLHLLVSSFSSALHTPLLLCDCVLHGVAPPKCSSPLLCLHD